MLKIDGVTAPVHEAFFAPVFKACAQPGGPGRPSRGHSVWESQHWKGFSMSKLLKHSPAVISGPRQYSESLSHRGQLTVRNHTV